MKNCAILDDYQECALNMADWAALGDEVSVTAFKNHMADEDELTAALKDFEIICIMRERTPFPRSLFEKLPSLELLLTSGMRNFSIDGRAAIDHGLLLGGCSSLTFRTLARPPGLCLATHLRRSSGASRRTSLHLSRSYRCGRRHE